MPTIKQNLSSVSLMDREFVGTVALRNEKLTLPDGSKVAIGIDGDFWVIVYQQTQKDPIVVYEYNATKRSVLVDKKYGTPKDIETVRNIAKYFFEHTEVEDLVTIVPGRIEA